MSRRARAAVGAALLALALAGGAAAQQPHLTRPAEELERELASAPMQIVTAAISRPKIAGDITLKAEVSFAGRPPYRVKLRRAEPGGRTFNNEPRYELAAYELQKLFLDPAEYVVPPTALRMMPLAELSAWSPEARPTFKGSDDVLVVLQYWLQDVMAVQDVYEPARCEGDPAYARHIGQLNILTYLIAHADSNVGNFLISRSGDGACVFSVDNGVAFGSEGDRGELWREMRVDRLPADAVERLRKVGKAELDARLGVLAQWELRGGRYVAVTPGSNLGRHSGVRAQGGTVQLGLTATEIFHVRSRLKTLLKDVDRGKLKIF